MNVDWGSAGETTPRSEDGSWTREKPVAAFEDWSPTACMGGSASHRGRSCLPRGLLVATVCLWAASATAITVRPKSSSSLDLQREVKA